MIIYPQRVLDLARKYVNAPVNYSFSPAEEGALKLFFTNTTGKVFFLQALPSNVGASLLSRFSRIKNPRGLRGVFVDNFVPQFLAWLLPEVQEKYNGNSELFVKENQLDNLDAFSRYSGIAEGMVYNLAEAAGNFEKFLLLLAHSPGIRDFLSRWQDNFGHNSISRMGYVCFCCEGISLLGAKTLEWGRPGSGYIELSTRYVDMHGKDCYPIELELEEGWGVDSKEIINFRNLLFSLYRNMSGDNFDGVFPNQLREKYGELFADSPKSLQAGVIGETCDVLGNLLPASTLTSIGLNLSGEAFSQALKHLILDNTPENLALAEAIFQESRKVGANQFASHYKPTEWEWTYWQYSPIQSFKKLAEGKTPDIKFYWDPDWTNIKPPLNLDLSDFRPNIRLKPGRLSRIERSQHDKLPRDFEMVSLPFWGVMSFRSWRDLHRQGFCTHIRSYLSPRLGFYSYEKPPRDGSCPTQLYDAFEAALQNSWHTFRLMQEKKVPAVMKQYPLAIGNNVGFVIGANLRQWEFCIWQRTKPSVNHEVRQIFIGVEKELRRIIPGWQHISRANMVPGYVFARGEKVIPLNS